MPVVNPSSRGNRRKSSRARPDFTPPKLKRSYLRFDCVAGRAKIVGHASGELFSRECRFNIDIAKVDLGWLDFQANAESAIVGTDPENPPPGVGAKDGPKWGAVVRVAMPYATTFDGVEIEAVSPCLIKTTTELLLEALAALWDSYDQDTKHKQGEIAVVEVARWETVIKAGGKKYFRPRFKILGFVRDLEEQFEGAINKNTNTNTNTNDDDGDEAEDAE